MPTASVSILRALAALVVLPFATGACSEDDMSCAKACSQPSFDAEFDADPVEIVSGSTRICLETDCGSGEWSLVPESNSPLTYRGAFSRGRLAAWAIDDTRVHFWMLFLERLPENTALHLRVTITAPTGAPLLDVLREADTTTDHDDCARCQRGFGTVAVPSDGGTTRSDGGGTDAS